MTKTLWTIAAAAVFAFFTTAYSSPAQAATLTCDGGIDFIDYQQPSSSNSEMLIGCRSASGTVTLMYAYTNSGTCTQYNKTLDTLKFWFSMVSSWSLSSKKVQVYYEACGGQNRLTAISLRRQ